jgi:hypothetical protein
MKFPVAFRVFASLNIIGFIVLLIQTVLLYNFPAFGVWLIAASAFATIWLLVTSFFWFFGSKKSYPFLYLTPLMLWLLGGITLWSASATLSDNEKQQAFFMFIIYGSLCSIYGLFMLVTMFFAPVKKWCSEAAINKADLLPIALFTLIGLITFGTFYLMDSKGGKYIVMDEGYISEVMTTNMVTVNYDNLTEFSGLVISKDDTVKEIKALVYFANNYEAKNPGDFFQVDTIVFKPLQGNSLRDGEYLPTIGPLNAVQLVAEFKPVKARRIMVVDLSNASMANHQYAFSPVNLVPRFQMKLEREKFITYDNVTKPETEPAVEYESVDYGEMEASEDGIVYEDLANATNLTSDESVELVEGFLGEIVSNYEQSQYHFSGEHTLYIDDNGFGKYVNFRTMFNEYTGAPLNRLAARKTEEERSEFSMNSAIWTISGVNMYVTNEDLPFNAVNPAFLRWAETNLIPEPDQSFMNHTSQEIYNNMFRRTMWMLAAAYEEVGSDEEYQAKANAYYEAMTSTADFYGPTYLYETYGQNEGDTWFSKVYQEFPQQENEYFYFDESIAMGFWLRRKLDGTDKEVFRLLEKILEKYDNYVWG